MPPKRQGRSRCILASPAAARPTPTPSKLEFRAPVDDAWYSVRIQREGETLRVMYCVFPVTDDDLFPASGFETVAAVEEFMGRFRPESDELFPASGFETVAAVEEFMGRFRPESIPVEDEQCAQVVEGTVVLASNKYREDELKFYDAVVHSVSRADGERKCSCTFNLLWQHGPLVMKKTQTSIDNVCFIQSSPPVDPILDCFLDVAKGKVEARITQAENFPESLMQETESMRRDNVSSNTNVNTCSGGKSNLLGYEPMKSQSSPCNLMEMTSKTGVKHTFGGNIHISENDEQRFHLGSSIKRNTIIPECYYFFGVTNLEKDISPVCIMDFIYEQTTISSVAVVFPALLAESYSTGIIYVETKEMAEKMSEFLLNPGHVIMSLRGRPLAFDAKWNGSMKGKMPKYEGQSSKGKREHIGKLKLVTRETKEFVMGVQLQQVHMKFHEHIEGLHDSLEFEVKNIASRFLRPGTT